MELAALKHLKHRQRVRIIMGKSCYWELVNLLVLRRAIVALLATCKPYQCRVATLEKFANLSSIFGISGLKSGILKNPLHEKKKKRKKKEKKFETDTVLR